MTNESKQLDELLVEGLLRGARFAHEHALALAEDLTEEQLRWQANTHAPSIGFHLWHLARWADWDVHDVTGVDQIWTERDLAAAWGFPNVLGENATGTELSDDAQEILVWPSKRELLEYVRDAFEAVDGMLDRLALDALQRKPDRSLPDEKIVNLLGTYVLHDSRHLGMIEALRGMMDLRGTATR